MVYFLTQFAKYILIALFAVYTFSSFTVLFRRSDPGREKKVYKRQTVCMYALHLICYVVIFAVEQEPKIWLFYLAQIGLCLLIFLIYHIIYRYADRLIVNHMCMLMLIGFTELTRLDFDVALRQFEIAAIAVLITAFVPRLIVKVKSLRKLTWVYCGIGILALGAVLVLGHVTNGAKISFTIAGISIQPSEFIKIIFVLFVACRLYKSTAFKDLVITTIAAALHVLILVASSDLGAALIFFVTYVCMLFVATRAPIFLLGGFGVGALAAIAGSKVFHHVKTRIAAWKDPFANINDGGYQVAQALFAIGTGGWFGMGLYQGMPTSIPVQTSDFIFAAIAEEFGGVFGICIILVCLSCFIMIMRGALQVHDRFYQIIALGFGVTYGTQVFLNIGGVIKCIPSTGVQLPFVSSGGSSIFCTVIIFAIIQGIYILRKKEADQDELLLLGEDEAWQEMEPVRSQSPEPININRRQPVYGGAEEVLRRRMQKENGRYQPDENGPAEADFMKEATGRQRDISYEQSEKRAGRRAGKGRAKRPKTEYEEKW